ncbi:MAG: RHS repeat-associated core domain-containing protein, partial [Lachnospiraceae bacterium]|nr:RHS repeat-associated core domain-containing protein [Lachnospiraceae bacterium]
ERNGEKTTYIYTYDAVGNRTARNENGEKTEYTYNSRNQPVTETSVAGTVTYSYDANGNLLKQSGMTDTIYTYDAYNRLTAYQQGEQKESYTYDAEGVRRSKTTGTDSIYFVSDTRGELSQTLAETDGKGNVKAEYTRADNLTAQMREGEVSYYLYDGHGDVRALLNEAGRITDKYCYNAYGELIEKTGDTENHYLYTGEYYDGTSNLYYLRARYMNPATGNFLTMDTYEGSIYDPDTLHKYLYANGNPVTYSDPSGNMFDFSSTAMGMGIQNVLNNAVQISYRGVMCGLINMTLTAVMGGSWEQAKSSFVTGFILGAGISVVRYFAVGAELVTLARFYVLSASANFIFSATMTVFAVTKGYSNLAVTFGVMVILSIAEWCWAYGNYLLIDVYGNNGSATIECNPSGESENNPLKNIVYTDKVKNQMDLGDYHSFPESVDEFGGNGKITSIVGGDNVPRTLIEISGSYMGKEGVFQYIIEPDGITCNHRLFVPDH